jgi:hypothetical protein
MDGAPSVSKFNVVEICTSALIHIVIPFLFIFVYLTLVAINYIYIFINIVITRLHAGHRGFGCPFPTGASNYSLVCDVHVGTR